ncbi:protein kinase [Colletotrichum incanum]|uniref:Protein kinase n=1 Tax=Colletotrichum incanum TaxID=1573173 RepID=A0A166LAK4_COLIC|nr:protein kinase [Colletotrichum incanum]
MKFIATFSVLFAAAVFAQSCTGNELQVCQGNRIKFCNLAKNNVFDYVESALYFKDWVKQEKVSQEGS